MNAVQITTNPPFGTPWGGKDAAEGVEDAVNAEYQKGFEDVGVLDSLALVICSCFSFNLL